MSSGNAPAYGAPPPGLAKSTKYGSLVSTLKPQGAGISIPDPIDSPELLAKIETAVVDFLGKKPSQTDTLAKVGIYLRGRNLVPQEGLKRFITNRPHLFTHLDDGKGGNRARLVNSSSPNGGASSSSPTSYIDHNNHSNSSSYNNNLTPPGIDESLLERQLVSYIYVNGTRDNPVTAPELGEYCKRDLGFSMKGYLTRFLLTRKQIFCLPDDGRQHVLLQSGAVEALGVVGSLPHLPEDLLGSSSDLHRNEMQKSSQNSNQKPVDYGRWDRITQEMYDFAVSRGGSVPYKEVDVYIKARCPGEIAASGVSLENWQAQRHSWKRRNVFKKEGNCLVVHSGLAVVNGKRGIDSNTTSPAGVGGGHSNNNSTIHGGENGEAFPPLSVAAEQFIPKSTPIGIGHTHPNETLNSFIRERKTLEDLQREIYQGLASIDVAAFSELQKENAGLRAACITLGQELLAVKDEILDLKTQLAEHGINLNNRANVDSSDANGGSLDEMFLPADLF